MKITGIIPARYGSTRFPGKPLININGKPMIQRVYEQVSKSKLIKQVIVATDDKRIYKCVTDFGGKVFLTDKKHKSGTDRICEVAGKIRSDIIVNIQGDEPFINPSDIDRAIKPLLQDRKLNVSTLAFRINKLSEILDTNKVKVVFDKNGYALYFSRNLIPFYKKFSSLNKLSDIKVTFYKHIGIYVYRTEYLLAFSELKHSALEKAENLEQLRILENGERIKVVITKNDSISIDTPSDLLRIIKSK